MYRGDEKITLASDRDLGHEPRSRSLSAIDRAARINEGLRAIDPPLG